MIREPKTGRIWLSADEVAERCHVSSRTVLRWRNDPDFPETVEREDVYGYSRQTVTMFDWDSTKEYLASIGAWDHDVDMPDVSRGRRPANRPGPELGL